MVELRLDRRLQGRINPSEVLQEAFIEVARSLADYVARPEIPFHLWLRLLTGRKLQALHRHHLGTQLRDADREVPLYGDIPAASSACLAECLADRRSHPSHAAARAELRSRVQQALDQMSDMDREVVALRHFEQLSNAEIAQVLGLSEAAASIRYIRALERLRPVLADLEAP
jgi:RNA polymerase sigma-70 factor (ECF subfamily)